MYVKFQQVVASGKQWIPLVVTVAVVVIMRHPRRTDVHLPLFPTATGSQRSIQPHPFTQMYAEHVTMYLFVITEDFIIFLL